MAQETGTSAPATTLPNCIAFISGRVVAVRSYKDRDGTRRHAAEIRIPAPDTLSHPGTVEVSSDQPVGEVGEDVRVKVRISGSIERFSYVDQDSGQPKKGQKARHYLNAVA